MLKSQRKKGARNESSGFPFPNFALQDNEAPTVCTCMYDDTSFLVHNTVDIQILYGQGGFGRSTMTMRAPLCFVNRNYQNQSYYKKAKARGNGGIVIEEFLIPETMSTASTNGPGSKDSENGDSVPAGENVTEQEMVVDAPGLSIENADSETPEVGEHDGIDEALELMPEEAMFLTFGLGCLKVQTSYGKIMSSEELWNDLVMRNPEFPIFYAVYHHFRCKNWIPKSGQSYGGDFVLYEVGPEYYHALYIVHIVGLGRPRPAWLEICSRQRCASHASKCALFCEVSVPDNFCPETPMSIFDLRIKELPVHRWTPSQSSK